MISKSALPLLGIQLAQSGIWHMVHTATANIALGLIGLHVALHWRWVVSSFQHYVITPLFGKVRASTPRDFRNRPGSHYIICSTWV